MNNIKPLAFLSIIAFLGSCRSQYASLYESPDKYRTVSAFSKRLSMQVDPIQPLEVADLPAFESEEKVIEQVPVYYPELSIADKEVIIPAAGFSKESTDQQINRQDPKTKAQKKKQQQRRRFWKKIGGNLVVGTVFLGIAILLALLHIESLAILFGLASILFLIFGLKKVFKMRRRQIKNPFRKNT